jgi:hypothetical protein
MSDTAKVAITLQPDKNMCGTGTTNVFDDEMNKIFSIERALCFVLTPKIPVGCLSTRISGIILDQGRERYRTPLPCPSL